MGKARRVRIDKTNSPGSLVGRKWLEVFGHVFSGELALRKFSRTLP